MKYIYKEPRIKKCLYCGKDYIPHGHNYSKQKFCSLSCSSKSRPSGRTGKKNGEYQKYRASLTIGKKSGMWKGDKVGYFALHAWIRRNLGKAKKCEHCGKESHLNKNGRNCIHWANKSHKYKRELTDWISLCVKCHKKYDMNYIVSCSIIRK